MQQYAAPQYVSVRFPHSSFVVDRGDDGRTIVGNEPNVITSQSELDYVLAAAELSGLVLVVQSPDEYAASKEAETEKPQAVVRVEN